MTQSEKITVSLVENVIKNSPLPENFKDLCDNEILEEVYNLSKSHDITQIVSAALFNNNIIERDSAIAEKFFQSQILAIYRFQLLDNETTHIYDLLEKKRIPFIPLKGSVIRYYYPDPWMRTSCDIDILIKPDDVNKVSQLFIDELKYKISQKGSHDIAFSSENNVHIELHFTLLEEEKAGYYVLKNIWDKVIPADGCKYRKEMPFEILYFYHIAHMAKHFLNGGCGFRSFIDLEILENNPKYNKAECDRLLAGENLLKFSDGARRVNNCCFSGCAITDFESNMLTYVFGGGVYGNLKNKVSVQQSKSKNTLGFYLSKIFLPYDSLKYQYPIIKRYKFLTPIYEVLRWFRFLFIKNTGNTINEIHINQSISKKEIATVKDLINKLGI